MIKYDHHLDDRFGIQILNDHTIRKQALLCRDNFKCMQAICTYLMAYPDPMVVPIYNFEVLESPLINDMCGVFKYQYDMKRLGMLNRDEKTLINLLKFKLRNYSHTNLTSDTEAKIVSFSKEYPELVIFIEEVLRLDKYHDIHGGNFLKDEDERYLIIDVEGFVNVPINQPRNEWFLKDYNEHS